MSWPEVVMASVLALCGLAFAVLIMRSRPEPPAIEPPPRQAWMEMWKEEKRVASARPPRAKGRVMTNESATLEQSEAIEVRRSVRLDEMTNDQRMELAEQNGLAVIASTPGEMRSARDGLLKMLRAKRNVAHAEHDELEEEKRLHIERKWGTGSITRRSRAALNRVEWYDKAIAAVEAGYFIVPNFDMDATPFAIRTADRWHTNTHESSYRHPEPDAIEAPSLPVGEGEYASPIPPIQRTSCIADGKTVYVTRELDLKDPEFPFDLAVPLVCELTAKAMESKIFDEIVCTPARKQRDPMVLGRIHQRGVSGWKRRAKSLTFVIAWYIRPEDI